MSEKRKVKVNLDELSAAFEIKMMEADNYLDLETGEVVMVTDEARSDLEEIYDEIYDEDGNRLVPLENYLQQRDDFQDWYAESSNIVTTTNGLKKIIQRACSLYPESL